ncbi:hypothetical protein PIROE2DRAFT_8961 [Piromyces sp. E2]|nr:hypothetical protein PIROE2DRAFT_8961 [Piromyces sp. E2]|eukprot:OUM64282.1 hypothetical protein PIROE2DRAFT_8961 [Piromyces sp. E2]
MFFFKKKENNKKNTFDIYSIFKYDEGKKYFESLTCESDSDCPVDSKCFGNKCMVPFYCKKRDKSTCALFYSYCYDKHNFRYKCFREKNICDRNVKCLGGVCTGFCPNKSFLYDDILVSSVDEYNVNYFTFENAKKYFEKMDIPCDWTKKECPKNTECMYHYIHDPEREVNYDVYKCTGIFYCKNKNICSFHQENINNRRVKRAEIAKNVMKYGLLNDRICWADKNCISDHCVIDKLVIGFCKSPSDSDGVYIFYFFIYGFPLLIANMISCCIPGYHKYLLTIITISLWIRACISA